MGVSTEDIDVITENTKNVYDEEEQRTEVHCPPPPLSHRKYVKCTTYV